MRPITAAASVAATVLLLALPGAAAAATAQLSFTEADGGVFVVPPAGGSPTSLISSGVFASFSPDGTRVAYLSGGRLLVAKADGTSPKRLATGIAQGGGLPTGGPPSWSPNAKRIAYSDGQALWTVSAAGGRPTSVKGSTSGFVDGATHPVWSHNGKTLYYLAIDEGASVEYSVIQVYRVPVTGGTSPTSVSAGFANGLTIKPFSLSISPSGRTLAVTLADGTAVPATQYGVGLVPIGGGMGTVLPGLTAAAFAPSGTQLCAQTGGDIVVTTLSGAVTSTPVTTVGATGCAWTG